MSDTVGVEHPVGGASPLGRALVITGDMWSVRIVLAIFRGHRRFQVLREHLAISDPVLSRRLRGLVEDGICRTRDYQANPPRHEYLLTEAGLDLWRVMVAMWSWDRTWAGSEHRDARSGLRHTTCRALTSPVLGCARCGAIGLSARDVQGSVDERLLVDVTTKRSRRSSAMSSPIDAAGVLGDRWSTLILSDALMGSRRFGDFEANLHISPVTLSNRLALFVDAAVLSRESITAGARRQEYRLTPKGLDFFSVTSMINDWAALWLSDDRTSGLTLLHTSCGQVLQPRFTCNTCNQELTRADIEIDIPVTDEGRCGGGARSGGA